MKDAFRFIAIVAFIAFVVWLDNSWEISPQDIQQNTIPPQTKQP